MTRPTGPSLRRTLRRALDALLWAVLAATAGAQQNVAPAGVQTVVAPPLDLAAGSRAATHVADRGDRVFDHTVNGALIGAGTGLAYVLVLAANADNHGEGPPVFVLLPAAGAVLGVVVGTFVGLVRTQ